MSWMVMLLVLPPTKTNLATTFLARQGRTWVVKRATSLFNLVWSNVAKQVARFFLPVLLRFSLVLYSFFGVQTSVLIQNYVDFGPLFLGIIIHFVQVWSFSVTEHYALVSLEKQVYCQPQMYELYRGVRGHVLPEKKMKTGFSETTYPAFPGSNAINSYVYFVELSVLSLVIHNSRALFSKPFQSQANCKLFHVKSLLISSQSECFLTVRFSFEYAILLIFLARPSYFKQCLIFQ